MEKEIADNLVELIALGTLSMFTFFGGVLTFIILYQKKVIRSQKEKQDLENQYQKEMLHNYIETQEDERKRIAADLHDNVGASLAAVKMMINRIKASNEEEQEVIKECKEIVQSTADSTRQISHNLLPPSLDAVGLSKVLQRMSKNISSQELKMTLDINDNLSLNKKEELALFRITQELVNNTIKYAKASQIQVHLSQTPEYVYYRYFDNGIGFSTENSNGLGFKNIATRSEMIHATHEFYSTPHQENGIKIKIPCKTIA